MLTLNIPDADADLEERLRESAKANGHSLDEEARLLLEAALSPNPPVPSTTTNLADAIHELFAPFGGVELDIPPRRGRWREPPTFD